MKSFGGLFDRVVALDNLRLAAQAASRGKRGKPDVAVFLASGDGALAELRTELIAGSYRPGAYRQFRVLDPKPRIISCAPFPDRVVHHAVCDVAMPLVERRFIDDSFACRQGKGTHRAVARAQELVRQHPRFLKLDVKSFFESVDHGILIDLLGRVFKERQLVDLLAVIVRSGPPGPIPARGLPIGNLTSQWFANLYLDGLDHRVKEAWGAPEYVRYMDDMLVLGESRDDLRRLQGRLAAYLEKERGLMLKASATQLGVCRDGVPFLGMRIFPGCWRLQRQRFLRTRRRHRGRERAAVAGLLPLERLVASTRAAEGILSWFGLRGILPQGVEA